MGRYRRSDSSKHTPESISFNSHHREMLTFLEEHYKAHRSKVIQDLIEREYLRVKNQTTTIV